MAYFEYLEAVDSNKLMVVMCDKCETADFIKKGKLMQFFMDHKERAHMKDIACSMRNYVVREILTENNFLVA